MVHALEAIHRLLRPGGCLIDIHPFSDERTVEIYEGNEIAFSETVPAFSGDEIRRAEAALADVVRRRLFVAERAASFDFRIYASSIAELYAYVEDDGARDEGPADEAFARWAAEMLPRLDEQMRAAGEGARIAYRERAHITRLRRR
jgi:hypothetical protein